MTLTAIAGTPNVQAPDEAFGDLIAASVYNQGPGVAVLVARDDNVIYRGARGMASIELGVPLDPAQRFRIGSITKTFTAASVLKLDAEHKLALNDPLSKFLPGFPNGSHITLSQLLSHTSGVSDNWTSDPAKPLNTEETVKQIASVPADFPPGTAWVYSNSGYILLGAVIEKVTGKPWHEALRGQFLAPLRLDHTGFFTDEAVVPGKVTGYTRDATGKTALPTFVTISGPGAAGALVSTVDDLFRWMRALVTGHTQPGSLYQRMAQPASTSDGSRVDYGFGLMLGRVRGEAVVEHNGGIEGFSSHVVYFVDQHVTVIVLANSDSGSPNPRSLAHRLGALAIGKPYTHLQAITTPPELAHALSGTYRSDKGVSHVLAATDGGVSIQRGGGPSRPLVLAENDRLFYPDDATDYIQLVRNGDQRVIALDFYVDGMAPPRRETRVPK
ncbi:serine hydrolase domain-containing protein [Pinirhizobacter sp.]|uniref:serine hydrolase domain-containing protein n=1 Tax=Pinirhizobacter sp. TaxID=2950432 RepID=UPI002F414B43